MKKNNKGLNIIMRDNSDRISFWETGIVANLKLLNNPYIEEVEFYPGMEKDYVISGIDYRNRESENGYTLAAMNLMCIENTSIVTPFVLMVSVRKDILNHLSDEVRYNYNRNGIMVVGNSNKLGHPPFELYVQYNRDLISDMGENGLLVALRSFKTTLDSVVLELITKLYNETIDIINKKENGFSSTRIENSLGSFVDKVAGGI